MSIEWVKHVGVLAVVAVVGAGFVAAGCGGGSDSASTKTASGPTMAEFARKGDQICAKANAAQVAGLKRYSKSHPQPKNGTQYAWEEKMAVAVGLPPLRREVRELRAMTPPSNQVLKVKNFLNAIEAAIEAGERDPGTLIGRGKNIFVTAEGLAAEYGFKVCGSG